MAQIIKLLVVSLALVLLIGGGGGGGVHARRDLFDYCRDLSKIMSANPKVYTDAQEAYKEARSRLKSIFNVGVESRAKLASAWKAVVQEAPCEAKSPNHVWIIFDCAPQVDKEMATLNEAAGKYASRCLTPDYWDKELTKTFGKSDATGISDFLSDLFIKKYQEHNPGEKIFFGSTKGPNCCHVMRSFDALMESMELVPDLQNIDEALFSDKDDLDKVLERRMVSPCYEYHDNLAALMMNVRRVGLHYPGGEQLFIDRLSPSFQNAIFRYEFCVSVIYPNRREAKSSS